MLSTHTSRALGAVPRQLGAHVNRRHVLPRRGVATAAVWDATGLSQQQLMLKDQCVVVDEADNVIGHESKRAVHRFEKGTPTGLLHRAFSVFLFDPSGRLLLQQRAADKITFPSVWTNTCCSHPVRQPPPRRPPVVQPDGASVLTIPVLYS